jgi:predicted nuclease with RNAse H fold
MALAKTLRKRRMYVIESYPGAAQDILGFPRKRVDLADLQADLANTGIIVASENEPVSHHEVDALTSALVGYFYLADMYEGIGNKYEGRLIIPRLIAGRDGNRRSRTGAIVASGNEVISMISSEAVAAASC